MFMFIRQIHLFKHNFFLYSDDERIGCFVISLGPLQKEINYVCRRYHDALTSSLYTAIHKEAIEIDNFMSKATELLEHQQSADVEEFSENESRVTELLRTTPEVIRIHDTFSCY